MKKYLVEFIGTFFLVLVIGLSANPIAIGAALMVMIYMGGHISGAHYNPAVTISAYFTGNITLNYVIPFILSQVLGSIAAAFVIFFIAAIDFVPSVGVDVPFGSAFIAEFLFTAALCMVVLAVACSTKIKGNQMYGIAIGSTVMMGAFSVGELSGGVFNPAVAAGPAVYQLIMHSNPDALYASWLYWVAPILGGIFAALIHNTIEKN